MRKNALTFAATLREQPDLYDCAICQKHRPQSHRDYWGCRRQNDEATSKEPITALDAQIDHCPGLLVMMPFTISIYALLDTVRLGYSLGDAKTSPFPEVESIAIARNARDRVDQLLNKGE